MASTAVTLEEELARSPVRPRRLSAMLGRARVDLEEGQVEVSLPPPRSGAGPSRLCGGLGVVSLALVVSLGVRDFAASPPTGTQLFGALALLLAAIVADCFPVQAVGITKKSGGHSLGMLFCVSVAVLFGPPVGILFAPLPRLIADAIRRKRMRVWVVNAAGYGVAAVVANTVAHAIDHTQIVMLIPTVLASLAGFYAVNLTWCTFCMRISGSQGFARLSLDFARAGLVPAVLMVPTTVMLVALWQEWPPLALMLASPLISTFLYQQSVRRGTLNLSAAMTDMLTGLGNDRAFAESVARELARAERRGAPVSLCLVDLDGFKQVNDTRGHPAGDEVLRLVGAELRGAGEGFRRGGDEFAVLLPGDDAAQATVAAERILRRISALRFEVGEGISASIGVASYPVDGGDRELLVAAADKALYQAKAAGKNRVELAARGSLTSTASGANHR